MIITSISTKPSLECDLTPLVLEGYVSKSELKQLELVGQIQLLKMNETPESLKIRSIAYCDKPGKEKVIVIFEDNTKIIKAMCPGDTFDLNIGVALAVMEKIYGTKSQYHKTIQSKIQTKK